MSHTQYTTPQIGCRVYASPSNGTCKPGSYIGTAHNIGIADMSNQSRIDEILGMLSAYRNGWISYDKSHVLELQKELANMKIVLRSNH